MPRSLNLATCAEIGAALVLVLGGVWKALDPSFFLYGLRSATSRSFFPPLELVGALVFLELALAAWLLSGRARRAARWSASALFLAFTAWHVYARARGVVHPCGCFGRLWQQLGVEPHGLLELALAGVPALALWVSLGEGEREARGGWA